MMHCARYDSPLGPLALRSNGRALTSLQFGIEEEQGDKAVFADAFRWLDAYFSGLVLPLPALSYTGSSFRVQVWQQCCAILYGKTCTYGQLAQSIGNPWAARAVGTALAHNPLLIMIPCHRVLPSGGGVGHYAAGSALKQQLLQWETT